MQHNRVALVSQCWSAVEEAAQRELIGQKMLVDSSSIERRQLMADGSFSRDAGPAFLLVCHSFTAQGLIPKILRLGFRRWSLCQRSASRT